MTPAITLVLTDDQVRQIATVVASLLDEERGATSPDLVGLDEAAALAGVSSRTIGNWCSRGRLTRYGVPRRPLVDREELLALLSPPVVAPGRTPRVRSGPPRRRKAEGHFTQLAREQQK